MMSKIFNGQLLAGEHVQWEGRPRQGLMLSARDGLAVPFSVFWCAFCVFWESKAVESGQVFMMFWGLPFIAMGVYMLIGRFFHDAWLRSRIAYAVTDQRVLIAIDSALTTLDLGALQQTRMSISSQGRGTIRLGPEVVGRRGVEMVPTLDPVPQLLEIDNVERVFAMLQKAQAERRTA